MINEVFIIGEIISKIKFDFIYGNKKKISIARLKIKLNNKSIVECVGYNEIADKLYCKKEKGDLIILEGKIAELMKIEIISFS